MQYNGDVSDTILAKLSSYYNEHASFNTPYLILRTGQYEYILVYGNTTDYQTFTDSVVVQYVGNSQQYNTYYSLSVTENVTYSVPTIQYSGFVYSSSSDFIPSRYTGNDRVQSFFLCGIFCAVILFCLATFISALVSSGRRRL